MITLSLEDQIPFNTSERKEINIANCLKEKGGLTFINSLILRDEVPLNASERKEINITEWLKKRGALGGLTFHPLILRDEGMHFDLAGGIESLN